MPKIVHTWTKNAWPAEMLRRPPRHRGVASMRTRGPGGATPWASIRSAAFRQAIFNVSSATNGHPSNADSDLTMRLPHPEVTRALTNGSSRAEQTGEMKNNARAEETD